MTTAQHGGPAGGGDSETVLPPPNSFAGIVLSIYNDLLANALHDVVSEAHRAEKLLRTQQVQLSAATESAKPSASSNNSASSDGADNKPTPAPESKPLIANPMTIFPKEIICPKCKLPRHTLETLANSTGGKEEKKKYCSKLPYQSKHLHDIYGNPSPTANVSAKEKKAKAAAAAAAQQAAAADGTAGGENTTTEGGDAPVISIPNGRKPDAVYFKCTNCSTEKIAAARFAAHLEKCLGLAGRKSSRAAMAKISGNGTGSQGGSGAGSPALGPVDLGKASGKATPDMGDFGTGEALGKKEKLEKRTSISEEGGINVPPPPPVSLGGGGGTMKIPGTVVKKKKKPVAKDSTPLVTATEDIKETATTPVLKDDIQVSSTSAKDPSTPSVKKRKRKVEAMVNGDASTAIKPEPTVALDDKDASITLARTTSSSSTPTTKPPPTKKQKVENGEGVENMGSPVLKKNQLSKFKDRDSPGPGKKGDVKRDSIPGGKFPPGRTSTPPPSSTITNNGTTTKPSSPVISNKHPPSASPKPSPSKLAKKKSSTVSTTGGTVDGVKKVKSSSQFNSTGSPKIAKKTLPGSGSGGINVPPPPKIPSSTTAAVAGKSLPKMKSPILGNVIPVKEKKELVAASPEKMRKSMSNGGSASVGKASGGGTTPKTKVAKANGGGEKKVGVGGTGAGSKTVPGKRVGGGGDGEAGLPRKRPKVGGGD